MLFTTWETPVTDQTEGQRRVRLSFNPGDDKAVHDLKQKTSDLIDLIYCTGNDPRCSAMAMTAFEEAAMWAV